MGSDCKTVEEKILKIQHKKSVLPGKENVLDKVGT